MDSDLTLIRLDPDSGVLDGSLYEISQDFDEDWWGDYAVIGLGSDEDLLFKVQDRTGREVARALVFHDDTPIHDAYGAPDLSSGHFQIQYFEVAASARRTGVGSRVVGLLESEFEGHPLIAFSEGGDEFWSSLPGWGSFNNREEPQNQLLFIRMPNDSQQPG